MLTKKPLSRSRLQRLQSFLLWHFLVCTLLSASMCLKCCTLKCSRALKCSPHKQSVLGNTSAPTPANVYSAPETHSELPMLDHGAAAPPWDLEYWDPSVISEAGVLELSPTSSLVNASMHSSLGAAPEARYFLNLRRVPSTQGQTQAESGDSWGLSWDSAQGRFRSESHSTLWTVTVWM